MQHGLMCGFDLLICIYIINWFDLETGYPAAQALELSGVQTHELTRFFRAGVLKGRKVAGGALLLGVGYV